MCVRTYQKVVGCSMKTIRICSCTQREWKDFILSRCMHVCAVYVTLTYHTLCVGYPLILSVCRTPPRAKSVNAFRDYHIAFHGTRAGCLLGILDSGTLLVPGMLECALVHVALFMPKGALCVCGY